MKQITVNGVEYDYEALSDKAKVLVQHLTDVDSKMASMRFSLEQLNVTREAFITLLQNELEVK